MQTSIGQYDTEAISSGRNDNEVINSVLIFSCLMFCRAATEIFLNLLGNIFAFCTRAGNSVSEIFFF